MYETSTTRRYLNTQMHHAYYAKIQSEITAELLLANGLEGDSRRASKADLPVVATGAKLHLAVMPDGIGSG